MKSYGRLIGIDVGTRRIGLARTDLLRMSVNPIGTLSPQEVWGRLQDLVEESRVLAFVVGWPTSLSGETTSSTKMAERFIRKLEEKFPDIPVRRVDERYSSVEAVEQMVVSGVPKQKRREKGRVDRVAAALLLQWFMEQNTEFN